MPMPETFSRTCLEKIWVRYELCGACWDRGFWYEHYSSAAGTSKAELRHSYPCPRQRHFAEQDMCTAAKCRHEVCFSRLKPQTRGAADMFSMLTLNH